MFSRILCPLDLSDFSRRALEHALVIGRWYKAEMFAVHVFATWVPPGSLSTYPAWMMQIADARKQIEEELHEIMKPAQAAGLDVPLVIREGDPVTEILAEAERVAADLIVLSTHGRSGFDRMTLGSVTEKVLRKATSPVLVVPAAPLVEARPFAGYRRILCATDFSPSSARALDAAISVARRAGVSITLLHVLEAPEDARASAARDAEADEARASMRQMIEKADVGDVAIELDVAVGTPHREILRTGERTGADLIVMGVRGRGPVDLTLFGSTTNQVVRRAGCAVLTVRT